MIAPLRKPNASGGTLPHMTIESTTRQPAATLGAWIRITKPRVIELLLVTTVPAMVLANGSMPDVSLVLWVLFGGTLAAGGANTINSAYEWERDLLMERTAQRPVGTGEITPKAALVYGVLLNVIAFVVLAKFANLLAAILTLSATLFYVLVYTIWLKPRTVQNIVIGGAAGAIPVLVGWAAVQNSLEWPAFLMFGVIFLWTPAHFWALAIHHREDYARASTPMLPVVRGVPATVRQIIGYAVLTAVASVPLAFATGLGNFYLVCALALGLAFVFGAVRLRNRAEHAMRYFVFSNTYLSLLFVAMLLDVLLVS